MTNQINVGDNYKGGTIISKNTQGKYASGANGKAKLPVNKRYIGRQYVIVQFSDKSTSRYWL